MSCWVIVLPPSVPFPARALTQTARTRLHGSRAPWSKNRWSSMATIASTRACGCLSELDRPVVLSGLVRAARQHLALEHRARSFLPRRASRGLCARPAAPA